MVLKNKKRNGYLISNSGTKQGLEIISMLVKRLFIWVFIKIHNSFMKFIKRFINGLKTIMESNFLSMTNVLQPTQFLHSKIIFLHSFHRNINRNFNHILLTLHFQHCPFTFRNCRIAHIRIQRAAARTLHDGVGFAGVFRRFCCSGNDADDGTDDEESGRKG